MAYQPNRLFTDHLSRSIVEATRCFPEYLFLLRPSRRFLFYPQYQPRDFVPEFNKPCFGVLACRNDPDKRPQLVIETEMISDALHQSYVENEVLWVEIYEEPGRLALTAEHGGVQLSVTAPVHKLSKMLAAPLAWVQAKIALPPGRLVQSYHERLLREAVEVLAATLPLECHHQVPFGFATGYRNDMPRSIARAALDIVITIDYETDPDGSVLLPVKIDLHNSHTDDLFTIGKDRLMQKYAEQIEMPLMSVHCGNGPEEYVFECPVLGVGPVTVRGRDKEDWARALVPFVREALRYIGRTPLV